MTTTTTTYRQRDIILVRVPYTDNPDEDKKRPAIIISPDAYYVATEHVIVLPITGNLDARDPRDVEIKGKLVQECNLAHPSIIKVGFPLTAHKSAISRRLATMPNSLYEAAWAGFMNVLNITPPDRPATRP